MLKEWTSSPSYPCLEACEPLQQGNLNDYLDSYEEVENLLNISGQYDGHKDVSTTYLGTE